jgi:tetratricopeptide (TPR) repeat protein
VSKAIESNKRLALEKVELGEMLFFNGNPKAALKAFKEAILLNPDLYQAHADLATFYQQNSRLSDAVSEYREIVRLHPKERDAYVTLGNLLREQGDLNAAIDSFKTALSLPVKEHDTDTESALAFALLSNENLEEALDHFDRLLASGEKAKQCNWLLGKAMALFKLNKREDASKEIDRALSIKPNYPAAHNLKGDLLYASDRKDDAINEYSQAILEDPLFADGYLSLGNLFLKEKEFKAARDILEKGEKIKPADKNILYGLAYALENCGDVKAAIEKYQAVLAIESKASEKAIIEEHLTQLRSR